MTNSFVQWATVHLVTVIREHFSSMEQMPEQTHRELLLWLRRYMLVGGMPAAVKKYIEDQSVINVPELQMMILNAYTADMAKYAEAGESTKIQNAFRSLPAQLAKDNKKFQYKLIRKGATAGLFGDSIAWLVMAGVVLEADRVTRGEMPVRVFRMCRRSNYICGYGTSVCVCRDHARNMIRDDLSDVYKGALTENYVAQTLKGNGYDLYYWTSDSPQAEVDFVIQKHGKVIPVEVKYGENVHARSIKHYIRMYHRRLQSG